MYLWSGPLQAGQVLLPSLLQPTPTCSFQPVVEGDKWVRLHPKDESWGQENLDIMRGPDELWAWGVGWEEEGSPRKSHFQECYLPLYAHISPCVASMEFFIDHHYGRAWLHELLSVPEGSGVCSLSGTARCDSHHILFKNLFESSSWRCCSSALRSSRPSF